MKAFRVEYRNGHFIDTETKKRIIPIPGAFYTITGKDEAFASEDEKLGLAESKSPDEKREWVLKSYGEGNVVKLLPAGKKLYFRVGNSKVVKGDLGKDYRFSCLLLEDLYLYKLKDKLAKDPNNWRLVDCNCQLEDCITSNLTLSEKLPASSLNKLFSQTIMFYFSMQRSGSTNVFATFYQNFPFSGSNSELLGRVVLLQTTREEKLNEHFQANS